MLQLNGNKKLKRFPKTPTDAGIWKGQVSKWLLKTAQRVVVTVLLEKRQLWAPDCTLPFVPVISLTYGRERLQRNF